MRGLWPYNVASSVRTILGVTTALEDRHEAEGPAPITHSLEGHDQCRGQPPPSLLPAFWIDNAAEGRARARWTRCCARRVDGMRLEAHDSSAQSAHQPPAVAEGHAKRLVQRELHAEFPSVPHDQVSALVDCLWAHFEGAPIRDFVPLLVRKQAKEELRDHPAAARRTSVRSTAQKSAWRTTESA